MAVVELAVGRVERIVVEKIAVVDGDDFSRTGGGEVDAGFAVGDDSVIDVDEGSGDVGYVIPVWCECGFDFGCGWVGELRGHEARGEEEVRGFAGGVEFVGGDDFAVGAGDCFESAGFEGNLIGDGAGVGVEALDT